MSRIPCGALHQLQPAERDAVEEELNLALADLSAAIEDVWYLYVALQGTVDYVLSGKRTRAGDIAGLCDIE